MNQAPDTDGPNVIAECPGPEICEQFSGSLSSWSTTAQQWVVGTGTRTVYVGPSSRQFPLYATVRVAG